MPFQVQNFAATMSIKKIQPNSALFREPSLVWSFWIISGALLLNQNHHWCLNPKSKPKKVRVDFNKGPESWMPERIPMPDTMPERMSDSIYIYAIKKINNNNNNNSNSRWYVRNYVRKKCGSLEVMLFMPSDHRPRPGGLFSAVRSAPAR